LGRQTFVTAGPDASRVRIEFQPLPASEDHPFGFAWGALGLWLGDTLVWNEGDDGEEKPVQWSWVNLLEGLGRVWPWLTLEESYPIPIHPEHPGKLDYELSKRWDGMSESQRDDEEDLIFDFNQCHNLALLVRGVNLPRVMVVREGQEVVFWSPMRPLPVRIPFTEFVRVFEQFGDMLNHLLLDSTEDLAILARRRWGERASKVREYKFKVSLRHEDPEVRALVEAREARADLTAANDDIYADDEVRAAARMTAKKFTAKDRLLVLQAIQNISRRQTPGLDKVSQEAPDVTEQSSYGFVQGYELARWFRQYMELGTGFVDPVPILNEWGVELVDIKVDPEISAVAVWGRLHGPGVILNSKKNSRASGINGYRATLAHEICHLIFDRQRSLPVADVMGGLGPQFAEKRANAFAAEFLLPQSSAEEAVRSSDRLEQRFGVSRAIVHHQILNSYAAEQLKPAQVRELEAWARLRPGFPVVDG